MSVHNALYQQLILDHNRNPQNFRRLEGALHSCHGNNPLCGDDYSVFVELQDGSLIQEVAFYGSGCAISKASASLMTVAVQKRDVDFVHRVFEEFHKMISGDSQLDKECLGKLIIFQGVAEFPARVKCASLAWHTLLCALNKEQEVTTE